MLDGWRKVDPSTIKKLTIEVDILKLLVNKAYTGKSSHQQATADLMLVAFYYMMPVGEYTCKRTRNRMKKTAQF